MEKPERAASRMLSLRGRMAGTMSAKARRESSTVSMVSNRGSLSSWLSLLYARGWLFIRVSREIRWPLTRPTLPRTSSGTSGFFFCGMIEEPVQKRSGSSIKLNWAEVHTTSSSDIRDRCVISSDAKEQNSMAKSRSETESSEFSVGLSKDKAAAVWARSMG